MPRCHPVGRPCLPHNWAGAVAFAAALHFTAATTPEASAALAPPIPVLLEHDRTENPLREELLRQPLRAEDGCIAVPDGPGLGVDVDEEALARYCHARRRSP